MLVERQPEQLCILYVDEIRVKKRRYQDASADLKNQLKTGDRLLVKGSRGSAMEEIVGPIVEWASGGKK